MPSHSDFKRKNEESAIPSESKDGSTGTRGGTPRGACQGSKVAEGDRLGTNAESISSAKERSEPTSSTQELDSTEQLSGTAEAKRRASREKRYELQTVARGILLEEGQRAGLLYPENFHKVCKCLHTPTGDFVGIRQTRSLARAHYTGLVVCAKPYQCAVCAAKIQEIRRQEIQKAIDWAYENGFKCIMVTLTFPHGIGDVLKDLMERFAKALERLRGGEVWKRRKIKLAFQGLIRSLEITFGANGWHPHVHELWIVGLHVNTVDLEMDVLDRWRNICQKLGLLKLDDDYFERVKQLAAFNVHSVDIKDRVSGSNYFAKLDQGRHWGVDAELAKSSTKKGKKSGRNPFQILESVNQAQRVLNDEHNMTEKQVADLKKSLSLDKARFVEFTEAFKGKAQIFWTAGLKNKVGVNIATDDQAAMKESLGESELLALLTPENWAYVRKNKLRAELLNVAEIFGYDGVFAWFKARGMYILSKP